MKSELFSYEKNVQKDILNYDKIVYNIPGIRTELLGDVKESGRHWKLNEEALDRTIWRTVLWRGYGLVVR